MESTLPMQRLNDAMHRQQRKFNYLGEQEKIVSCLVYQEVSNLRILKIE